MSNVDRFLEGAIDIHVHFEPDPRVERRADALETAQNAKDLGMRGLVLKSHEYPTTPVIFTGRRDAHGNRHPVARRHGRGGMELGMLVKDNPARLLGV